MVEMAGSKVLVVLVDLVVLLLDAPVWESLADLDEDDLDLEEDLVTDELFFRTSDLLVLSFFEVDVILLPGFNSL